MSSPSRVEEIFFAALELQTAEERAAYLEQACGADVALRFQVQRLLEAHPQARGFLGQPAVDRDQIDARHASTRATTGPDLSPPDPKAQTELMSTLGNERGEGVEDALKFLEASDKPGSLGRLAHYEVLEVLGNGGFGTVAKAFDEKLHRFVAIKFMSPLLAANSAARKRFVREARSAAAVRHANVIAIFAVEDQPIPYLVMDYIAGRTLQQKLDETGPLELRDVLRIGQQTAAGLAGAHAMGLIHRDIKPGNILLEDGVEHVKITDFGLARAADDASLTQSGFIAGTPMYMAPEQALGEKIDQSADLFSLGSVLYTMCSGRPPFRAANTIAVLKRVVEDAPRPIREIIPEVPEWLCELISKLHAKNPADRVTTAEEVSGLLGRRLAELQGIASIPEKPTAPRSAEVMAPAAQEDPKPAWPVRCLRFFTRRRLIVATAVVLVIGCLGFTEATGVTDFHGTVIRLFSADGVIVVEVDDPGVSVRVEGSDIVITGTGAREIRLRPGRYVVEATKNGKLLRQELVTVTKNDRQVVRVSQEPPATAKDAPRSAGELAWERVVAALSATEQVKAVHARLKERNPGFDSPLIPVIEAGVVREVEFNTDDVTDLSPLRALNRLRTLRCSGFGDRNSPLTDLSPLSGLPLRSLVLAKGELFDLSPLRGMPLTEFKCYGTRVNDLSPLRGMNLRILNCDGLHVSDLSPLMGMPLETLDLTGTQVEDLTALAGMKLEQLGLERTKVSDLSPLKGMRLTSLSVCGTSVSDLSPLSGMKLTFLHCGGSNVSDLSPLNGMPLTELNCAGTKVGDASLDQITQCHELRLLVLNDTQVSDLGLTHLKDHKNLTRLMLQGTRVSDLSPLKDMPLEEIRLTPRNISKKGLDLLRHVKTLKTIGTDWNQAWPAAEFWARYEKGEFSK